MLRPQGWKRRARNWTTAGIACGTLFTLGSGCRSSDSDATRSSSGVRLAGLTTMINPPVLISDNEHSALVRHSQAVALADSAVPGAMSPSSGGMVQSASGSVVAGDTTMAVGGNAAMTPPPASSEETVDLEIALRLAGIENPTIALAREQIRESLAQQLAARSLMLPTVNIGGNYHLHTGSLQASYGGIRIVNSQSLYLGFGARTLAAETVAFPGIRLFAHLGDAIYEPLAARQEVVFRESRARAVQNDMLGKVAAAYMELIEAEARINVLKNGEVDATEVARLTKVYAEKGQGRDGDANRAASHVALLHQEVIRAEGDSIVASARLCRLLSLDPSVRLRTPGGSVLPFTLVPEETETESLVAQAVQSRPEVFAKTAEIRQAQVRVRQEKLRPFLPLLSAGYSGGLNGGGSNLVPYDFSSMTGRSDFDAFASWNLQNLGFGNRAQVRKADAVLGESVAEYDRTLNLIRREVSEARANALAAAKQIEFAKTSLSNAEEGYKLELSRIKQGGPKLGRPIEVLDSFQQLLDARQELLRAIVGFDIAQFRLFVAIGSSPMPDTSPEPAQGKAEEPAKKP